MKNFSYVAKDFTGKKLKGSYYAENSVDLTNYLADKGLFCISFTEGISLGRQKIHKIKTKDLAIICRQLSSMMNAGLTLVKALDIIYKEQNKEASKRCWLEIYQDVQKGQSFSSALIAQTGVFPNLFISMISEGETSGNLDVVLERLSEHYTKERKLQNQINSALVYPIILFCFSIIVVFVVFTFIMPTFKTMFQNSDSMPALTKVMFSISDFMRDNWYIVLLVMAGLIVGAVYSLKIKSVKQKIDKLFITLPFVGKLVIKVYTGRFARTLSSLYSSGLLLVECLQKSIDVIGNLYISEKFEIVIDSVKQGETLSVSISETKIFEPIFCSMLYVGEESGNLDEILLKTADYYEEESQSAITRLVALIEPLMILVLGVIIALIVLSIYPALTEVYNNI